MYFVLLLLSIIVAFHARSFLSAYTVDKRDDFYALVTNKDALWVDKSLLIREYLRLEEPVVLITRPRRFGKTVNIHMLRRFLEIEVDENGNRLSNVTSINRRLFVNENRNDVLKRRLKISSDEPAMKLQGEFPVLFVSFKNVTGTSYPESERSFRKTISLLFDKYRYLRGSINDPNDRIDFDRYVNNNNNNNNNNGNSKESLSVSLRLLTRLLSKRFDGRKVHVLIDDYDQPLADLTANLFANARRKLPDTNATVLFKSIFESTDFRDMYSLCRKMYNSFLIDNPFLEKAYISGTLTVMFFDDRDSIVQCRSMHYARTPFDYYYGFLPGEIDKLTTGLPFEIDRKVTDLWFKGYTSFDGDNRLYNPYSIIRYLKNNAKLDYYWIEGYLDHNINHNNNDINNSNNSSNNNNALAEQILLTDDMQQCIEQLIDWHRVDLSYRVESCLPFDLNRHGLQNFLYYTGYLTFHNFSFQIPNRELNNVFKAIRLKWIRRKSNATASDFGRTATLLADLKLAEFRLSINRFITAASDKVIRDASSEFYRLLIEHILHAADSRYVRQVMIKSGLDEPDTVLISKAETGYDNAIVIRFKILPPTTKSLSYKTLLKIERMIHHDYTTMLSNRHGHVKRLAKIALTFSGRRCDMQYHVQKIFHLPSVPII